MPTIECRHVCRYFKQGEQQVKALDDVSLSVEAGEFLVLSGPSGSGKTTLLNAIGALDSIDGGEIRVDGEEVTHMSQTERANLRLHKIGFVFQSYNLIPVLSARENVEFVMLVQGVPAGERAERADRALADVGLAGLEERRPAALSGGQQQRVAVARALVSKPAVVLADEPTANLDSKSSRQLLDLFLSLNRNYNTCFVIASHDAEVMETCPRRVSMLDGRIVDDIRQLESSA